MASPSNKSIDRTDGAERQNADQENRMEIANRIAQERQIGRDLRAQKRSSQAISPSINQGGLRGRLGGALERSIDNYDRRGTGSSEIGRAAEERAAKRGLSQTKARGAAAAAEAAARGEGARGVAESAASGALEAKKYQQYRMILIAIKGGSAITLVGILITLAIWLIQLVVGHLLGQEKWKMSTVELFIAVPIFAIIFTVIALFIYIASHIDVLLKIVAGRTLGV